MSDRVIYRCARCEFVLQPEEIRVLVDEGWVHPTCVKEGEL